jgi:hypothetical protein
MFEELDQERDFPIEEPALGGSSDANDDSEYEDVESDLDDNASL